MSTFQYYNVFTCISRILYCTMYTMVTVSRHSSPNDLFTWMTVFSSTLPAIVDFVSGSSCRASLAQDWDSYIEPLFLRYELMNILGCVPMFSIVVSWVFVNLNKRVWVLIRRCPLVSATDIDPGVDCWCQTVYIHTMSRMDNSQRETNLEIRGITDLA